MPMVTIIKTFRIDRLLKTCRRSDMKLNMLMCWCIGRVASDIPECFFIPSGEKLMKYDCLAINVIVKTKDGHINTCDVPFSNDISQFNADYLRLTLQVHNSGEAYDLSSDYAIVGTSTLTDCYIDGAVNQYSGIFNNPFLAWGRYRRRWFKTELPISFQFHHAQMDGNEACKFLNNLQALFNNLPSF